ncbi:hypothetical protein GCM10020218_062250 [Dactylosporangium vinaceum]|uniref:Uncharacterized protein n=1 Tax=Dactylosporangium vinaceum TaxID=53362 RepID=A0ABV5M9Q6_9ACTN|nr:hypothetical protein [Dactylosporangium vinaceum]
MQRAEPGQELVEGERFGEVVVGAGGPSKLVGLATITDTHGNDVTNPVFELDGAFDPDS